MNEKSIRRLMIDVALTRDEELDCEAAEPHMEQAAADGRTTAELDAHLRRCAPCREVFDGLQAMSVLEAVDELPAIDTLWDQIRPATRDGALEAVQHAAPPRPAAAPIAVGTQERAGWFSRLSSALFGPTPSFAPAALSVALLLAGVGWWQALDTRGEITDLRSDFTQMETELSEAQETIRMVALVNRSNFARSQDGSWARIIYHEELDRGMVYAGALPELAEGQEIACWLLDEQGEAHLVWQGDKDDFVSNDEQSWWPVEADRTMSDFNAMRITVEPTHETLVEIPFSEQNS